MRISILTVGKIKEQYWQEAIDEYVKRISPYANISFIEVADQAFSNNEHPDVVKKQEATPLLKKIKKHDGIVIALDEHAPAFTSVKFAAFLAKKTIHGDHVLFIIGGARGLHQSVIQEAHHVISLSQMTFPHNVAKVVLVEQLYRAITIIKKKTYHY